MSRELDTKSVVSEGGMLGRQQSVILNHTEEKILQSNKLQTLLKERRWKICRLKIIINETNEANLKKILLNTKIPSKSVKTLH